MPQVSDNPDDTPIQFLIGTLPDGRVLLDFRMAAIDHLKMTPDEALQMAEGLCEAAKQAVQHGRIIDTGFLEREKSG